VKYLPGGVKSGFVHVDPDDEEKRLFQVKGKRNIKVRQVRKFEKAWVRKRKS
jgi:gelsolin